MDKFPKQLIPLIIIFALAVTAFVTARIMFVPESFGEIGHYRADAVAEIASQELTYAGALICAECHDDVAETKHSSRHADVACEACHGPAADHVEAPDETIPSAPRGRGYCTLCHGYNATRPSGFPQILSEQHNPGKACMSCHDPHNPLLPHPPKECAACHREIVNQKNVSHHVNVDCKQCHEVPDNHLTNPRTVRAEVPTNSDICGVCHDRKADAPREIPKIDMVTHEPRYECWDCHYPHSPEAHR